MIRTAILSTLLLCAALAGCGGEGALDPPDADAVVVLAVGDIALCDSDGDERTAALVDTLPGAILTMGDNAYPHGSEAQFRECYDPGWGRHRARTHPSPGNHEYMTPGAAGYFAYFGERAGPAGRGWYSFDVGEWHVVSLNSAAPMESGSDQERWLRADLAANPRRCTLAYWHHPRFSSGRHGGTAAVAPLWQALYDAGADVVLQGHDHTYERFAPLDAAGRPDPARGIRSFVAGTGGARLYDFTQPAAGSEFRHNTSWGVLRLTLHAESYGWDFVTTAGASLDRGEGSCH